MVVHQGFRTCLCLRTVCLIIITIFSFILLFSYYQQLVFKLDDVTAKYEDLRSQCSRASSNSAENSWDDAYETIGDCKTIHLAAICSGSNATRSFYILLKSILSRRSDSIHLHLCVDDLSRLILSNLFKTWQVQDLAVSFYNITKYEPEIAWIPGQHYSHRYGLIKLILPSILHDEARLDRVIIIDTDMLVLGNIRSLWLRLDNMIKRGTDKIGKPALGLVENQSVWYKGESQLNNNLHIWPAIGQGFNTGIMLINLDELDNLNWRELWRQVAEKELISHLSTSLAEQDVINAVIHHKPDIVDKLPSSYNIQLNDHAKLDDHKLYLNHPDILKLVHWNSPYKTLTRNHRAKFFNKWYLDFQNRDGHLLEESPCSNTSGVISDRTVSELYNSDPMLEKLCHQIQPGLSSKLRTFLYYLKFDYEPDKQDVTFVTHLSIDRISALDRLASHWEGPISASIYLPETETTLLLESIESSMNLLHRRNIAYHLVFRDKGFNYPINRLRNIALDNCPTEYVLQSDIDLLPSNGLYGYLKTILGNITKASQVDEPLNRQVLVVPAFEHSQYKYEFPRTKSDLLAQVDAGSVSIFRGRIWPRGHAPTDYPRWKTAKQSYRIDWSPDYEPFVVARQNAPRFDERFNGFGWNKVQYIMQLAAMNYQFWVLPEAFLIHSNHPASYDIIHHRESAKYRLCLNYLKEKFTSELQKRYPEFIQLIEQYQALKSPAGPQRYANMNSFGSM